MSNWLERIRNSPIEKKQRLIYLIIGVVALVLILIWFLLGNPEAPQNSRQSGEFIQDVNQSIKDNQENLINPLEQ